MSDNESDEEQQQKMEEIFICADIWFEVFAFLDPFELGLKVALISDRLDVLVDVHFKSRKWSLGSMEIRRAIIGNGAQIITKRFGERWLLPIPQGSPPGKVIAFREIEISYIDQSVIEFLQRILFGSSGTNVVIGTSNSQRRSWEIIWQKIWPLANDSICGLLLYRSYFDRLQQFSMAILHNSVNLRSIVSLKLFPEFPAEEDADVSSVQAVAKWLLTPRGDGFPKMLICDFYMGGMEGLKESFVNASEPVNFIIRPLFTGIDPFELKNKLTGERLTLRRLNYNWLLVRCPIGRKEDKWAKWETEALMWAREPEWNCITINFQDSDIGDGMVETNEGPSEPND